MSAYEYLNLATLPTHVISERILQLEAGMFAADARIRAAARTGNRTELTIGLEAHRSYGEEIDALIAEQDRRAALPADVAAGEHPPAIFELEDGL